MSYRPETGIEFLIDDLRFDYDKRSTDYLALTKEEQAVLNLISAVSQPISKDALGYSAVCDFPGLPQDYPQSNKKVAEVIGSLIRKRWITTYGRWSVMPFPVLSEIPMRNLMSLGKDELDRFFGFVRMFVAIRVSGSAVRDKSLIWRESFYAADIKNLEKIREGLDNNSITPISLIISNPFSKHWVETIPAALQSVVLREHCLDMRDSLRFSRQAFAYFQGLDFSRIWGFHPDDLIVFFEMLFVRGDRDYLASLVDAAPDPNNTAYLCASAMLVLAKGEVEASASYFRAALTNKRRVGKKSRWFFPGLSGVLFLIALAADGSNSAVREASEHAKLAVGLRYGRFIKCYHVIIRCLEFKSEGSDWISGAASQLLGDKDLTTALDGIFAGWLLHWTGRMQSYHQNALKELRSQLEPGAFPWLEREYIRLLNDEKSGEEAAANAAGSYGLTDCGDFLSGLFRQTASWEITLDGMEALAVSLEPAAPVQVKDHDRRLVWILKHWKGRWGGSNYFLEPREQRRGKRGNWLKAVGLPRFGSSSNNYPAYCSEKEIQALEFVRSLKTGLWNDKTLQYGLLGLMWDHPLVFTDEYCEKLAVIRKGSPELVVEPESDSFLVRLEPENPHTEEIVFSLAPDGGLVLTEFSPQHFKLAKLLKIENRFPQDAADRVLQTLSRLSGIVTIHSAIGALNSSPAVTLQADERLYLALSPLGEGIKLDLFVMPFGPDGPRYRPGEGAGDVFALVNNQRAHVARNTRLEQDRLAELRALVPEIFAGCETIGSHEYEIPEIERALEVLSRLSSVPDWAALVWPEKKPFRKVITAGFSNISLSLGSENEWFSLEGSLALDENLVVDLKQLLESSEGSFGRFIKLSDDSFLALTEEFQRRLSEIKSFSEPSRSGRKIARTAALALEDLLESDVVTHRDGSWKASLARFKDVSSREYSLPSTLCAELREYQRDAFQWLRRMAELGLGACLADDMGLGKTIEALSVVIDRASEGPTLVVAPTSVCFNWLAECRRFAPTLRPHLFHQSDRKNIVAQLGDFDLLVCSYGLLQTSSELLSSREWGTIVLDEAQAIKNMQTARSKAAMLLRGKFKIIMTGTPVENHLGELWNLFRFINPGLLGSFDSFKRRFLNPIQLSDDRQARHRLKKLVKPFILRRTKSMVLDELPPKTEITLSVELSEHEASMYEATRRVAVEKLEGGNEDPATKKFRILAEIMKLRRFCCNPKLVVPECGLQSSKLQLFEKVMDELLANRHKSLVFSQFTDHLGIISELLTQKNVKFQYLDGSTPIAQRKQAVEAFQRGEGDVFLISLRAGGLGLNLTAADYVIHLDPWWNPAVEDQASDRSHRMGQQRPVTVYRLVTADTIEDKIVRLHSRKRDLADSLLEGTDTTAHISFDEIMQLLSDTDDHILA